MLNLKFDDFTESKYVVTSQFKEGLAVVKNQDNLYGYIDKKGKEVLPCQFTKAFDFSEGFAVVSNEENLFGFININGELKIPYQYTNATGFKEGLAVVKNQDNLYGYIDKKGKEVLPCQFVEAFDFSEGFAVVKPSGKTNNKKYAHINKNGETFGYYNWVSPFYNGRALIIDNDCLYQINTNYEKINTLSNDLYSKFKSLYPTSFDYNLFIDKEDLYGFLDKNLVIKTFVRFSEARSFQDDTAIIQIDDLIGFITSMGKYVMFSSKNQYQEIKDFSEGLAAVKNTLGLWGFIDKEGKEVITCQYRDVDSFSEGLSGVIDKDGRYCYINKNGTIKINLPIIYKSVLDTIEKTIYIIGKTEKELCEKKLKVLNQVKEELLKQLTSEVDAISTEVVSDLYQLTKTRKK